MKEHYAITGILRQGFMGDSFFGGFIVVEQDNTLRGKLIDDYGPSSLSGTLHGEQLDFEKIYDGRNDVIKYSLKRDKLGVYIGRFSGTDTLDGLPFAN
ncbi:MAG: hypothetical protein AABW79_02075 [Nanoarchaeota archaeon]